MHVCQISSGLIEVCRSYSRKIAFTGTQSHYNNAEARGRPNFGYGFGYGAETSSKMTFFPLSDSANVVLAKFPLRP